MCFEHHDSEKRFAKLFEAARVLLKDSGADEEEIFPTLSLAAVTGVPRFRVLLPNVKMARVVDKVPILRRQALSARAFRSTLPTESKAIQAIYIEVRPSKRRITADDVARAYEEVLRHENLAWGGTGGRVSHLFYGRDLLQLEVVENDQFAADTAHPSWTSPTIVGKYAEAVLEGSTEDLVLRKRGGELKPKNLILAMVARALADAIPRRKGGEVDRKEVHRLLNTHVLHGGTLLDEGVKTPPVVQLWRDVKKLSRMEELFKPGHMYISAPTPASRADGHGCAP